MENLDSRLLSGSQLAGPAQEALAGRRMRENRSGGAEESAEAQPQKSWREMMSASRLKAKAKEKLEEKVAAPAKQGTNWLLRWAWTSLVPSFGLSLIYINTHLFLRWVFPDLFCKLGEEWMPKIVGTGEHSAKNVAGTAFGIVEVMGLLILDLIAFFIVLAILALLVMIATWLGASWWGKLEMIYDVLKSLGWATIKALVSLF